jgi:Fe2+ or Zn2+ uptake regulation protein
MLRGSFFRLPSYLCMKLNDPTSHESAMPSDLRMTPQRRQVLDVLQESCDHPTAIEVFMRAKERMPGISLATVYNCLETLTDHGMIRQVNLERASSRYCANLQEHVHFHCENCGLVIDAPPLEIIDAKKLWGLPDGVTLTGMDVAIRGRCPDCTKKVA